MWARLFPFAWSGVAGSPTRARPGRPIAFTPSRVEPIAPPPRSPAPEPSAATWLARLGVGVVLVSGWLVFIAWWVIVLQRERVAALAYAAGVLAAILLASTVAMTVWTRHNIRVARKGNRGQSSLYIPMRWEHDTLGRTLELPTPAAHTASEVRIVVREGVKEYVLAAEAKP